MTRPRLEQEFLSSMVDDYAGAWEIERLIRRATERLSEQDVRDQSIQLVAALLAEGLIEAGELTAGGGFLAFEGSPGDVSNTISMEWNRLKGGANIGDVAWFRLTPKGRGIRRTAEEMKG